MPHKRAKHSAREQARSQQGADLAPSKQSLRTEAIPKGAARVLNAARIQQEWREKKRKSSEDGPRDAADGTARKRKRKAADDDADGGGNSGGGGGGKVKIMPGESLSHFNRRVEDSMRPLVRTAVKTSAATTRRTKKAEADAAAASAQAKKAQRASAATGAAPAGDAGEDAAPTPTPSSSQYPDPTPPAPASAKRPKTYDDSATRAVKHFAAVSTSAPRRLNDIVLAPPELKKLPRGAAARKAAAAAAGTKAGASAGAGANLRESMLSMAQKVMLEDERERAITAYRELKRRRTDG